jgi:hypothetical protein
MGKGGHCTGRGLNIFTWRGKWRSSVRDRFSCTQENRISS